eukprot:1107758-Amorphochlora_amoeboformis.AAC.2
MSTNALEKDPMRFGSLDSRILISQTAPRVSSVRSKKSTTEVPNELATSMFPENTSYAGGRLAKIGISRISAQSRGALEFLENHICDGVQIHDLTDNNVLITGIVLAV